jgi:hypothetical protein
MRLQLGKSVYSYNSHPSYRMPASLPYPLEQNRALKMNADVKKTVVFETNKILIKHYLKTTKIQCAL